MLLLPLSVAGQSPLDAQQIVFSRQRVASPVTVAHGIGHPSFLPCYPSAGRRQGLVRFTFCYREYLPVTFEPQLMVGQPFLYEKPQLFQLALIWPEYRQVIHIARVMSAQATLPDKLVERL